MLIKTTNDVQVILLKIVIQITDVTGWYTITLMKFIMSKNNVLFNDFFYTQLVFHIYELVLKSLSIPSIKLHGTHSYM